MYDCSEGSRSRLEWQDCIEEIFMNVGTYLMYDCSESSRSRLEWQDCIQEIFMNVGMRK